MGESKFKLIFLEKYVFVLKSSKTVRLGCDSICIFSINRRSNLILPDELKSKIHNPGSLNCIRIASLYSTESKNRFFFETCSFNTVDFPCGISSVHRMSLIMSRMLIRKAYRI